MKAKDGWSCCVAECWTAVFVQTSVCLFFYVKTITGLRSEDYFHSFISIRYIKWPLKRKKENLTWNVLHIDLLAGFRSYFFVVLVFIHTFLSLTLKKNHNQCHHTYWVSGVLFRLGNYFVISAALSSKWPVLSSAIFTGIKKSSNYSIAYPAGIAVGGRTINFALVLSCYLSPRRHRYGKIRPQTTPCRDRAGDKIITGTH